MEKLIRAAKPLWNLFCILLAIYALYKIPRFVLWTALAVFVGGGIVVTVGSYAAARYNLKRGRG